MCQTISYMQQVPHYPVPCRIKHFSNYAFQFIVSNFPSDTQDLTCCFHSTIFCVYWHWSSANIWLLKCSTHQILLQEHQIKAAIVSYLCTLQSFLYILNKQLYLLLHFPLTSLSELLTSQQKFPDSSTGVLWFPLADDPIRAAELNFQVIDGASLLLWMKKRMNLKNYRDFNGINMSSVAKFTEQSLKKNYQA